MGEKIVKLFMGHKGGKRFLVGLLGVVIFILFTSLGLAQVEPPIGGEFGERTVSIQKGYNFIGFGERVDQQRLLDAGCGLKFFRGFAKDKYFFTATGTELQRKVVEVAKPYKGYVIYSNTSCEITVTDEPVEELDFSAGYNAVVSPGELSQKALLDAGCGLKFFRGFAKDKYFFTVTGIELQREVKKTIGAFEGAFIYTNTSCSVPVEEEAPPEEGIYAALASADYPNSSSPGSTFNVSVTLKNTGNKSGDAYWGLIDRDTGKSIKTADGRGPWFSTYLSSGESYSWTESYEMPDKDYSLKLRTYHWEGGEAVTDETRKFTVKKEEGPELEGSVTLYTDENFTGESKTLKDEWSGDLCDYDTISPINDEASSVRVKGGWIAELNGGKDCEGFVDQGGFVTVTGDSTSLHFGDKVSSIKIETTSVCNRMEIHEDTNYEGASRYIYKDVEDLSTLSCDGCGWRDDDWNDDISSIGMVSSTEEVCTVTLYEDKNFTGKKLTIYGSTNSLHMGDVVSSVKIKKIPS